MLRDESHLGLEYLVVVMHSSSSTSGFANTLQHFICSFCRLQRVPLASQQDDGAQRRGRLDADHAMQCNAMQGQLERGVRGGWDKAANDGTLPTGTAPTEWTRLGKRQLFQEFGVFQTDK